jgi:hypothetical protein
MTLLQRSLTYIVVLILVTLSIYLLVPAHHYVPTGLLLPNGQHFSPVNRANFIGAPDSQATVVGYINVQAYNSDSKTLQQYEKAPVIQATQLYAQQLAERAGANEIVITQFGANQEGSLVVLRAVALHS